MMYSRNDAEYFINQLERIRDKEAEGEPRPSYSWVHCFYGNPEPLLKHISEIEAKVAKLNKTLDITRASRNEWMLDCNRISDDNAHLRDEVESLKDELESTRTESYDRARRLEREMEDHDNTKRELQDLKMYYDKSDPESKYHEERLLRLKAEKELARVKGLRDDYWKRLCKYSKTNVDLGKEVESLKKELKSNSVWRDASHPACCEKLSKEVKAHRATKQELIWMTQNRDDLLDSLKLDAAHIKRLSDRLYCAESALETIREKADGGLPVWKQLGGSDA